MLSRGTQATGHDRRSRATLTLNVRLTLGPTD